MVDSMLLYVHRNHYGLLGMGCSRQCTVEYSPQMVAPNVQLGNSATKVTTNYSRAHVLGWEVKATWTSVFHLTCNKYEQLHQQGPDKGVN